MTAPFATKWDFIFGSVLVVVEGTRAMTGTGPAGETAFLAWTSEQDAVEAARTVPGHRPAAVLTTRLLDLLPDGVGLIVQPGTPDMLWIDPDYATRLKELSHPLPGQADLRFVDWVDIPKRLVKAVRKEMKGRAYVEEVRGWLYTVDDSPYQGVLAYRTDAGAEGADGAANGLDAALASVARSPQELGLPIVRTFEIDSLPEGVAENRPGVEVYRR
jgi:hypothetical protein